MHSTVILALAALGLALVVACAFGAVWLVLALFTDDGEHSPRICSAGAKDRPCTHLAIPGEVFCRQHLSTGRTW